VNSLIAAMMQSNCFRMPRKSGEFARRPKERELSPSNDCRLEANGRQENKPRS
jgi:hypothetical protein